jgi:hypothetical protein
MTGCVSHDEDIKKNVQGNILRHKYGAGK